MKQPKYYRAKLAFIDHRRRLCEDRMNGKGAEQAPARMESDIQHWRDMAADYRAGLQRSLQHYPADAA